MAMPGGGFIVKVGCLVGERPEEDYSHLLRAHYYCYGLAP